MTVNAVPQKAVQYCTSDVLPFMSFNFYYLCCQELVSPIFATTLKMNQLPSEMKNPPLPSILILGLPKLHSQIKAYLQGTMRPPAHVLLDADLRSASKYIGLKLHFMHPNHYLCNQFLPGICCKTPGALTCRVMMCMACTGLKKPSNLIQLQMQGIIKVGMGCC